MEKAICSGELARYLTGERAFVDKWRKERVVAVCAAF